MSHGDNFSGTGVLLVPAAAKKSSLVCALVACLENSQRRPTRRFLQGLATDELQYIAEFLGACILESGGQCRGSRTQLAEAIKQFERNRRGVADNADCRSLDPLQDQEHKMILLLEYLCRSGMTQHTLSVGAGQG
jgi:hypothetical protein